MSAEPVVVTTRTRHPNGTSASAGKWRDLMYSVGAIGVGALGGYFALDYVVRTKAIENLLGKIGININGGVPVGNPEPDVSDKDETDKTAALAQITPLGIDNIDVKNTFDRTTRVNSYAARMFNKKPTPRIEGEIDISQFQTGVVTDNEFNQIVTDDDVYNSF